MDDVSYYWRLFNNQCAKTEDALKKYRAVRKELLISRRELRTLKGGIESGDKKRA